MKNGNWKGGKGRGVFEKIGVFKWPSGLKLPQTLGAVGFEV